MLAAAIGICLPLEPMVSIFLVGMLSYLVQHKVGDDDEEAKDRIHCPGMLFPAGLITGEALMGIAIAVPIVLAENAEVLALPETWHLGQWSGPLVLAMVGWLLYRSGGKASADEELPQGQGRVNLPRPALRQAGVSA